MKRVKHLLPHNFWVLGLAWGSLMGLLNSRHLKA